MRKSPERVLLTVKRFRQRTNECALASASSLANYYDPDILYHTARRLIPRHIRKNGLYTAQQAAFLNKLGFKKLTIVSGDLAIFDFAWRKLSKRKMIDKLKQVHAHYVRRGDDAAFIQSYINWLSDPECDNRIVIDCDLAKHIRRSLKSGRPVCASFNWTRFFKYTKERTRINSRNDICGEDMHHAVVIRGYDKEGIFVVDSSTKCTHKTKKYKKGYYKVKWERFLVNSAEGDMIIIQ